MMKIKINSTTTPLKVGAAINLTDAGTSSTPGTYAAAAFTNSGSGTGAVITVVIGAGGNATSATVTAGGDSYEANDVLTFSAIAIDPKLIRILDQLDLDFEQGFLALARLQEGP